MSRSELLAALQRHPFFAGLSAEELDCVAGCAQRRDFRAGQPIIQEGGEAHHCYALLGGKVAVQTFVPGRGAVSLQTLHGGELLGWSWLSAPHRWTFDARALEETAVAQLDAAPLLRLCEERPHLGYVLMKNLAHAMAERLRATRLQVLDVYGAPGARR